MPRVDRDELLRRYATGERNFAGIQLGEDLDGIDLSGADLKCFSVYPYTPHPTP
ncbi:hypothetical protein [Chlorogloeopsis sp. ULAP02]|uniref:hypothetical protein n=1 Tax=Chlorogloeopsis sp. ULAP02 TaxID=3107926 RepID=UPI003135037A